MSLIYKILETFVIKSFPKREGGAQNVAQTLKRPQNRWGYKGHTMEVRLLACDTTDILLYFSIRCKHNDGCSQFQGLQVFFLSIALLHFHFLSNCTNAKFQTRIQLPKDKENKLGFLPFAPSFSRNFQILVKPNQAGRCT